MTNAEKIRGMTDEELAIKIAEFVGGWNLSDCDEKCPAVKTCCLENGKTCEGEICVWLKSEVSE